jgi:nucleoside 2-deoxyribosyltransferase
MKLYFAGPLFTTPERTWNAEVTAALRAAGHDVFLPQEKEPGKDAAGIFATDVGGIDSADGLVAIMDGADPDSGTSWEVGYAYRKKPIVLVRTDMRGNAGSGGSGYNAMLTESATIRVDAVAAPIDRVARQVLDALATLESAP